jgi:putative Ca2+/H+ antiporter (TMEM165/GDT1 family)
VEAFFASLSGRVGYLGPVILVSEIGDKTFFIAAIMAMRHPRMVVFGGAIGALVLMTVLSTALGHATTVISRIYTFYASVILFFVFGAKMLKEGYEMSPTHGQVSTSSCAS